jgi:hypothetical protein
MGRMTVALALGALLVACERDPLVPLVQLEGVAPRQIELGDKLEIEGAAFPQGRKARVLFEGAFSRPGEVTDSDGEVEARGEVVAPDRIEIAVDDTLLTAFCGAGSSAAHTTFDGAITVVFAAQTPGAPPVSGNLQHTTIDVLPTAAGQARFLADAEDGDKLAHVAGMRVEARAAGGLAITSVEPKSRAAGAGLLPDDVIASANGVRALGVGDLAAPAGAASLRLVVRRGGGPEEIHTVALEGARAETPRRFAIPAAIVIGVATLLALLAASPGRTVLWLRRRLAKHRPRKSSLDGLARFIGVATACAVPIALPAADVSVLALVAFTGALAMALLAGTEHERSHARAAMSVANRLVPSCAALACALVISGSLRADELTAAQGAAPWGFFALRSPAHALLAIVFATWAARREGGAESSALPRACERFVATLHAALGVIVFFGGWRLPFAPQHVHGPLVLACAAVFAVKTLLVAWAVDRLRAALPPRSLGVAARATFFRLLPAAIVAGVGAAAWERHVTSRGIAAATTFGLAAIAAAALVQLAWPRAEQRVRVDPLA